MLEKAKELILIRATGEDFDVQFYGKQTEEFERAAAASQVVHEKTCLSPH